MSDAQTDFQQIYGRRPKVAIGHPMLGRGGSEGSLMWMIEALKQDCDVTVLTTKGWQLDEMNDFYGTAVRTNEVHIRRIPTPLPDGVSAAALRGAIFQRFLRRVASEYDIRISAYNPSDWGLPAIHKMADFSWNYAIRRQYDTPAQGFAYQDTFLRRTYLGLCHMIDNPSGRNYLGQDLILANSHWVAEQLREYRNGKLVPVEYPPVWCKFPLVRWEAKEFAFVMIGRIAIEKRIEHAIAILAGVRARGHNLKLHLCGRFEHDSFSRMIRHLCDKHSDWIVTHGQVTGEEKLNILSSCRYGIHSCTREAFGISVAEMIKAGAVVFAPKTGGQVEILDHEQLLFASEADAVDKIDAVLRSDELQANLRNHLSVRAAKLSTESFMARFRECVAEHARATKREV